MQENEQRESRKERSLTFVRVHASVVKKGEGNKGKWIKEIEGKGIKGKGIKGMKGVQRDKGTAERVQRDKGKKGNTRNRKRPGREIRVMGR